ncbi:partial Signal transduction histidine-protein kinase/phosphatase DegS, partial [Anaerolineae bacterium]
FALVVLMVTWLTATREKTKETAKTQAQRQATIAELGRRALATHELADLLKEATALLGQSFNVEFVGIFQAQPDGKTLLLTSGWGWRDGQVNQVAINADTDSLVGFAFLSNEPVILRNLHNETDLSVPGFLTSHRVIGGVSVVIRGHALPFGVLGVYSNRRRVFTKDDVGFLQTFADMLANAIERVQTETQVRDQGNWRRLILSSIGDGVIVTDPQGIITFINSIAQALIGWSEAEALAKPLEPVLQVMDEKTGKTIENPVTQVIRTKQVVKPGNHTLLVTRNNQRVPIDHSAAPMRDDNGKLIGVVLVLSDITERRRNEEAIRQSEERFRVALKDSPVVVFNQDRELRYSWVYNPTRGFPRQSVVGKTDADLMPPSDAVRWTEIKHGVLTSGVGTREEISATVDNQKRTFDLTIEPLRDGEANVVGITCASIDITERKREQATTARLAAIVESSEDAIIGKTLDGIILSWNPAAERLYGYTVDEIIGQPVSLLYPPDRMDEFRAVIEQLKRGEPVEEYDTTRVRNDGKPIDVSVSVSLVRDGMGRIIGAATIVRDITPRKRSEELQRFRTEASDLLSSSLDYETTLTSIARLAVPRIADWCAVHLLAEDGTIRQLVIAHIDPTQVERAHELLRRYPPDPNATTGVQNVIRTGQLEFVEHVTDEQLAAAARDPEHLGLLMEVGLESYMIVPLTVRKRTFGAISFVSAKSGRHFSPDELALAQDLANRAALSVENARLFQELQKANEGLERRVIQRTVELQAVNKKLEEGIAERQRVMVQLRQLGVHLQSAREEERMRVAREIHDEVGQVLTAVKMDLGLLARNLSARGKQATLDSILTEINTTSHLVDESIVKMREIIRELRPEILDHLGLKAAIEWQAQEFQTRMGIACQFISDDEDIPLDLDRSTAVFRILQETLTNVARHAHATRVEIKLEKQGAQLVLQVRDNGQGITENEIANQKSFGILGMRERALVFGGEVDFQGEPGRGTIVRARIPLEKRHD